MNCEHDQDDAAGIPVTRRDMVSGVAVGIGALGAGLSLSSNAMAGSIAAGTRSGVPGELDAKWTGPGGIGDYAGANGNTYSTVNAAHALRDGQYDLDRLPPVDEEVDLLVVGGGISGLCAAYEYRKGRPNDRILIMDNHNIFGGEAKQNEIEVDGYRLGAARV